jgi:hypothetical protein
LVPSGVGKGLARVPLCCSDLARCLEGHGCFEDGDSVVESLGVGVVGWGEAALGSRRKPLSSWLVLIFCFCL